MEPGLPEIMRSTSRTDRMMRIVKVNVRFRGIGVYV